MNPCPCWSEVSLHDGHCCFRGEVPDPPTPLPCGHETEGRRIYDAYQASVLAERQIPCGICGETYPHHHDDEMVEQDHLGLGLRKDWG